MDVFCAKQSLLQGSGCTIPVHQAASLVWLCSTVFMCCAGRGSQPGNTKCIVLFSPQEFFSYKGTRLQVFRGANVNAFMSRISLVLGII